MTMSTATTPQKLAGAALLFSIVALPWETKLRDSDHKNLGKLVGNYFTALTEEKDIYESMEKVIKQIASTQKRLKKENVLAAVEDWERVFWLVNEKRLETTMKKRGSVATAKPKANIPVSLAYCVPKRAPKEPVPLILVACDAGEDPSEHLETYWNDPEIRDGAVLVALELSQDSGSWGVFGSPSEPGGPYQIMIALSVLQREFPIDSNRRFLVGSGNAFAAAEATATSFPQVFAGLLGFGEIGGSNLENLENFQNLPSFFIGGGDGATQFEAKLAELGFANCKIEGEGGAPAAWAWMAEHPRDSYPKHLTFAPKHDNARGTHWISMVGFQASEQPRLDAKADRDTNTITIDADKVSELVIWLNDELVDMDQPVRFVINGTTHERTVERNAPEMIKNQYNTGDWGRVFSAWVSQDVPVK